MKRIITYLYEYHNGKKGNNIGFLKVDLRGTECRLQLHIQETGKDTEVGKVYLVMKGEQAEAVCLGEVTLLQGSCEMAWRFSRLRVMNSDYELSQVMGVGIQFPSGRYLASCWIDEPTEAFMRGTFREWKKPEQTATELKTSKSQEAKTLIQESQRQKLEETEPERPKMEELKSEQPKSEELKSGQPKSERLKSEQPEPEEPKSGQPKSEQLKLEQPEPEEPKSENPRPELQKAELELESVTVKNIPHMEPKAQCGVKKIDINYIHKLPKRNWYLCNNSFLIHGFFNYHYLVLREVEKDGVKKMYLGVPGVYERPERGMALLFGFPEFIPAQALGENESGKDDEYQDGTFGYWYCLLDT